MGGLNSDNLNKNIFMSCVRSREATQASHCKQTLTEDGTPHVPDNVECPP